MLDKSATVSVPPTTVTRAESTVPRHLKKYLALDDFEATARRRIPKFLYGYISGGAESDAAVRDNRKAFDEYGFVPRVLNDVSGRDQSTMLFGKSYASPFGIPPMGSSALCAYRGDIVLTKAARAANVPMILSASSLITLEDVRAANQDAWYQAYLAGVPERIEPLVDRVAAARREHCPIWNGRRAHPWAPPEANSFERCGGAHDPGRQGHHQPYKIRAARHCADRPAWRRQDLITGKYRDDHRRGGAQGLRAGRLQPG